MTYDEYMEWDMLINGQYQFPREFADEDGNVDITRGLHFLVDEGYITNGDIKRPTYDDRLKDDFPEVYRYFESFYSAHRRALMDKLVEDEYVQFYVEDEKPVYRWTAKGIEYRNKLGL